MDLGLPFNFGDSWWPIIISLVISVIIVIRTYVGGPDYPSNGKLFGKIVLITGASGGLGLSTAKELAARGAHVILTCRNKEKGSQALDIIKEAHPKAKIDLKLLDVSNLTKIKEFVNQINDEYESIDVLINNAGIIFHPYEKTSEEFELTMATNYFGPFTLSHLLLPLLSKSENGRIINVTALAHFSAQIDPDNLNEDNQFKDREVFGQSKLALILFTRYLAKLLKPTKITVNAVNPGLVRNTNHLRNSPMETSLPTKVSVWPWMWLFMKTPKQGMQTLIYAAVESSLKKISGAYLSDCTLKEPSPTARDDVLAKRLYDVTCSMCKIDGYAMVNKLVTPKEEIENTNN